MEPQRTWLEEPDAYRYFTPEAIAIVFPNAASWTVNVRRGNMLWLVGTYPTLAEAKQAAEREVGQP